MVDYEIDVGYKVTVSKVMNASGVANSNGDFSIQNADPNNVIESNTQYLVTLDVNGVNKLYRELWTSGDPDDNNVVPLGDYTFTTDENSINKLSEDDAVVVRFEEVEVKTSDAFRAAVSKTAPEAPSELPAVAAADKGKFLHANESTGAVEWAEGGGSGGGVLVVHSIDDYTTLDKTWQEIHDAALNGVVVLIDEVDAQIAPLYLYEVTISGDEYQVAFGDSYYIASSASGYPVYSDPNSEA